MHGMNEVNCPFCNLDRKPLEVTSYMNLIESKFPLTEGGHLLIVPKRHYPKWDDIVFHPYEWYDFRTMLQIGIKILEGRKFTEFNIGANIGALAGQTVPHAHFHIIARVKGDVEDPRGGIRNIIPAKGNYLKK
jgi:diadenosine tetraphosphate (Ap4A) HIT family hydrolase